MTHPGLVAGAGWTGGLAGTIIRSVNRALALPPIVAVLLLAGCTPAKDTCHSPSIRCGDRCIDGSRDPANCGGCGVTCGAGQTCCGSCVDLQTSAQNCGACDARCPVDGVCTAGACGCPPAKPDLCGTNPGACVNLQTGDGGFCGSCGVVCQGAGVAGGDATCTAGNCVCAATAAATDCRSTSPAIVCVNTLVDATNCGGCGIDCAPHATCASNGAPSPAGVCGCGNAAFPNDCGAAPGGAGCVNFATDPANCGGCGTHCSVATPTCSSGKCCPSGTTNCSGTCFDTRTSAANCGACGNACDPGRTCSGGSCVCTGPTPLTCGTNCCAGTGCCGTACQIGHSNGLGQLFFDCTATYTADTTTRDTATAAAQAWGATTVSDGLPICGLPCIAGQKPGECAIWCYAGSGLKGRVLRISTPSCSAAACPFDGTGFALWPSP